MQKAFLQCVMTMWTFKLFRNVAQYLHLSFVFQMKVVVCSLVLPYIVWLSKGTNDWQQIFHLWKMWKIIHFSFKPAHIVTTVGRNHYYWPQLVSIVAPVSSQRFNLKGTRWCTPIKNVFKLSQHNVHIGFSLVWSYTLGFSPLWKSLCIFKTVVLVKCLSQFLQCLQ